MEAKIQTRMIKSNEMCFPYNICSRNYYILIVSNLTIFLGKKLKNRKVSVRHLITHSHPKYKTQLTFCEEIKSAKYIS